MAESYITPFGDKYPMPWRSYVLRVIIAHLIILIGWPIIAFLTTGDWLHRWQSGIAAATVPAVLALGWGYFRRTKPTPLDLEFEAKLLMYHELEQEAMRKREDLP